MTVKQVNKPKKSPLKRVYLWKSIKMPAPGVTIKVKAPVVTRASKEEE